MGVYANLDSREGTVDGEKTITFSWRPRKITITNDSTTSALKFKFGESEAYATLNPTETVAMTITPKQILLSGSSVAYRIWGIG